ncbi:MAG: class I SAM-dependent methyltransferase [Myxococcota bacterium]
MGLYERFLLPGLTSWVCASGSHGRYRQHVVPRAHGRVVELGAGSGHNLPHYDARAVEHLWAVEPSAGMWRLARERLALGPRVEHLAASAEAVPLESAVADTVVVTWALCTIPRPELALAEARRLLKPGGRLLFAEHGEAPDEDVKRWQHRLDPVWNLFSGGCHINRDVPALLTAAGFELEEFHAGYLPGLRPFSFNMRGVARPR